MAATPFGFQFFVVYLHKGTSIPTQDFVAARLGEKGPTFRDSLEALEDRIVGKTRTGQTAMWEREREEEPEEGDTKPAIRVVQFEMLHERRLDIEFRYGRVGSHDVAIAMDEAEDAQLTGKASTNPYRATLYLPTAGHQALLVVENRANSCPAEYLLKHVSFAFKEANEDRPEEERIGWWRLMPKGASDTQRLDEVLRNGTGAALQLQRHSAKNGRRREDVITLRQDGLKPTKLRQVRALAFDWLKKTDPDAPTDGQAVEVPHGTPVQQIAALLDVHVSADDFNDGALVYDEGSGRTKTIRPGTIKDVFVYPVAVGKRPSTPDLRAAAEARIPALAKLLEIPIEL